MQFRWNWRCQVQEKYQSGCHNKKCHRLNGLNSNHFFLIVLEAGKVQDPCAGRWEALLLAYRRLPSCCVRTWTQWREREGGGRERQKQSSNSSVSFLIKASVSLHWGLGLQHRNLWGEIHILLVFSSSESETEGRWLWVEGEESCLKYSRKQQQQQK